MADVAALVDGMIGGSLALLGWSSFEGGAL